MAWQYRAGEEHHTRRGRVLGALACLALVIGSGAVAALYVRGQPEAPIPALKATWDGLRREWGLRFAGWNPLSSAADAAFSSNDAESDSARALWIAADGEQFLRRTQAQTVGQALAEAGILIEGHDRVFVNRKEAALDDPLPDADESQSPLRIEVRRALSFTLYDDDVRSVLQTTAPTVGEALWQAGITVYLGDIVEPGLETPLADGMEVRIRRSRPIVVLADDRVVRTRVQGKTVADALAALGIRLLGADRSEPSPDTPLSKAEQVRVIRVAEDRWVETETIPYETKYKPDGGMEIDQQRVEQRGQDGLKKRRFRVVYENGQEVSRVLEEEWIAQQAQPRIVAYGTKIVLREIETPEGVKRYWRKVRMLATSYTAATSGKSRDHPEFGITYMGLQAGTGVIAVDPKVIALGTKMYVPGYGLGLAGDTGGKIKGRRIDLCYDEEHLVLWYKWVDVYLLEPVPPSNKIVWILPNWPQER